MITVYIQYRDQDMNFICISEMQTKVNILNFELCRGAYSSWIYSTLFIAQTYRYFYI